MILLSPQRLATDGIILASFEVVKTAKSVDYRTHEFNNIELQRRFLSTQKPIKDALQVFTTTGIASLKSRLRAVHYATQSGKSFDQYFQQAFLREIHSGISSLMPFLEKTKCYHKIKNQSGDVRTSPCKFQNTRPGIQFELTRSGSAYGSVP
jgi:hypothetical protein